MPLAGPAGVAYNRWQESGGQRMDLRGSGIFFQTMARDFRQTGAIAPSSRALGLAMTSELAGRGELPLQVLEVGGGTGSITEVIAGRLRPGDRLDVFEVDEGLAGVLRRRMARHPACGPAGVSIRVFNRPIQSIERQATYDYLLSCLPFTNFDDGTVRELLRLFQALLKPGGVCSFYEYILIRRAAEFIRIREQERERLKSVARVVEEWRARHCFRQERVLLNLPPAFVSHMCFDQDRAHPEGVRGG
ncbi:MAG: methyltransferase domain-containing protein [Acidobacteria bacterium]|nr:methyltransferase domain-containing protein [Acidobacteriota bacterium]